MVNRTLALTTLFVLLAFSNAYSQSGLPVSFKRNDLLQKDIPVKLLAPIPQKSLYTKTLEAKRSRFLKSLEYGTTVKTDFSLKKESRIDTADGIKIYRFTIKSSGATSLGLKLTPKAGNSVEAKNIFIYTPKRDYVASTLADTKSGVPFCLPTIPGDCATLEVNIPLNSEPEFTITEVVHGDVPFSKAYNLDKDISQACNVDIACPLGESWQLEKNGVVKIEIATVVGKRLCTGTLVNNTARNKVPYVITANHCVQTEAEANSSVFYFGYEKKYCGQDVIMQGQAISGATLVATGYNNSLDFSLLKLSQDIPQSYNPYFVGWDIRKKPFTQPSAICIHHPNGDVKKISEDYDTPQNGDYTGDLDPTSGYLNNSHWHIKQWDVGTTEGGSSGSGLFSSNRLLVGTLTGGLASCDNSVNDYFSRINLAWNNNSDARYSLKKWLDPISSGDSTCAGMIPSNLAYSLFISNFTPCSGDTVTVRAIPEDAALTIKNLQADNAQEISGVGTHKLVWTLGSGEMSKNITADFILNGISIGTSLVASVKGIPEKPVIEYSGANLSTTSADLLTWYLNDEAVNNTTSQSIIASTAGSYYVKASNYFGCAATSNTVYVSLTDVTNAEAVTVYPNPVTSGNIYIRFSPTAVSEGKVDLFEGPVTVNLYDLAGRKLRSKIYSTTYGSISYDLTALASGMYLMEIISNKARFAKKIIVVPQK